MRGYRGVGGCEMEPYIILDLTGVVKFIRKKLEFRG